MNSNPPPSLTPLRRPARGQQGFALIFVLITILAATVMSVLFLSSAGDERRGVDLYARGNHVKELSEMPVTRVMGLINAASKNGTAATPVSWASQPGMVRTFDTTGNLKNAYKLYSSDTEIEGSSFDVASQVPLATWATDKAIFTDLNAPSNGVYPIVDPSAEGNVDGFSITAAPGSTANQTAPMPVKWLYVLEDGQLVAPTGSGTTATVGNATATNPIVGRIAYWTDDETCKVNINTASEGSYWDWPKAATYNEMQFAGNPPIGGEFNRTPGHPAMTSLSAVFPELAPGNRWDNGYWTKAKTILEITPRIPSSDTSSRGGTYPITTENYNYGPAAGASFTVPTTPLSLRTDRLFASPDEVIFTATRNQSLSVTPAMVRERSFFLTSQSRAPETTIFETPRISLWPITWPWSNSSKTYRDQRSAAFPNAGSEPDLSTTSPPSLTSNTWMRAEERLLAFTATLDSQNADGGDKYYFQRQNSNSPTHDYGKIKRNQQLLSYLRTLTDKQLPGYGDNFANKFTQVERDMILANAFNNIRSMVNQYTMDASSATGSMLYSFTPVNFYQYIAPSGGAAAALNENAAFSPFPLKLKLDGTTEIQTISEFPLLREAAIVFYATSRDALPEKILNTDPAFFMPAEVAAAAASGNATVLAAAMAKGNATAYANPHNWKNLINVNNAPFYPQVGARTNTMKAVLLLDFSPLKGSSGNNQPVFWIKLSGGAMTASGTSLGLTGATAQMDYRTIYNDGIFPHYLLPLYTKANNNFSRNGVKTLTPGSVSSSNYGLVSGNITVNPNATTFPFSSTGNMTVEIYGLQGGNATIDPTGDSSLLVASYQVDFSSWNGNHAIPLAPFKTFYDMNAIDATSPTMPNPRYFKASGAGNSTYASTNTTVATGDSTWCALEIAPEYTTADSNADASNNPGPGEKIVEVMTSMYVTNNVTGAITYTPTVAAMKSKSVTYPTSPSTTLSTTTADFTNNTIGTDFAKRLKALDDASSVSATTIPSANKPITLAGASGAVQAGFPAITPYDTVISVVPDATSSGNGDPRLAQKFQFIRVDQSFGSSVPPLWQVMPFIDYPRGNRQYHTLGAANNNPSASGYITRGAYSLLGKAVTPKGMAILGKSSKSGQLGVRTTITSIYDYDMVGTTSAMPQSNINPNESVGDWSSQAGNKPDGGNIPRPDQDFQSLAAGLASLAGTGLSYQTPYFPLLASGVDARSAKGYFSPNRQIPSPVAILGALPRSSTVGWQTLAFSPNPAKSTHPGLSGGGANKAPDHLWLDLFWMPVVEPYPISEEFATAGKINLNVAIMPFSYIKRQTGLHALMKGTMLTALNNSLATGYKSHYTVKDLANSKTRYTINATETLKPFETKFSGGDIFRSASQLCEMYLVPQGSTAATVATFWNDKLLTSDTAREEPYNHLYSRVTTKSNTYTVHWRVEALRKRPNSDPTQWVEGKDIVSADLRGSTLIERYINPNRTDIPDYATTSDALPLSNFYSWRVITESYFRP